MLLSVVVSVVYKNEVALWRVVADVYTESTLVVGSVWISADSMTRDLSGTLFPFPLNKLRLRGALQVILDHLVSGNLCRRTYRWELVTSSTWSGQGCLYQPKNCKAEWLHGFHVVLM